MTISDSRTTLCRMALAVSLAPLQGISLELAFKQSFDTYLAIVMSWGGPLTWLMGGIVYTIAVDGEL